ESAAHCGGCNQACPNGQVCLQGTCSVSAGTGGSPGSGGADPGPTGQGCGMPWDPSDAAVEEIRWLGHEALIARRTMMVAGEERSDVVAVPVDYDRNRA